MRIPTFRRARQRVQCLIPSLIILLAIPSPVHADDHGAVFLFPTRGLTFHYLDVVNVTYLSPFPKPNLYIFCDGGNRQMDVRPAAPYNGSVLELMNFTSTVDCWFNLRPGTDPGHGANSDTFMLLSDERPGTTVGLPQSSTTSSSSSSSKPRSTSSSTSSASPRQSTAPAKTNEPASPKSSGLSSGAAAGIGVGSSLGAIAIAGAAAACWWRRRRGGKGVAPAMTEYRNSDGGGYPEQPPRQGTVSPLQHGEDKTPVMVAQPYEPVAAQPYAPAVAQPHIPAVAQPLVPAVARHYVPAEVGDANIPAEMQGEWDRRPELP